MLIEIIYRRGKRDISFKGKKNNAVKLQDCPQMTTLTISELPLLKTLSLFLTLSAVNFRL